MNIYLQIIKPLLDTEEYLKYQESINTDFIQKNYPDISKLYKTLPTLHKNPGIYSIDDLKVSFFTCYPNTDIDAYNHLFNELRDTEVNEELLKNYLVQAQEREQALQLAKLAIQASEGVISLSEVYERYSALLESPVAIDDYAQYRVPSDLALLRQEADNHPGLHWRLKSLNRALGPLRKGNFGFIFARPESGKSTFLCSELSEMATQIAEDEIILWFNNEEKGTAVEKRIYQAALGITRDYLDANEDTCQPAFEAVGGRKIIVYDHDQFNRNDIEKLCKLHNPVLMVIDQIDNVKGFKADRPDLEYKEIYQWARGLAKRYGPVIGICQAGGMGENKKWLTMNDVDGAKTSKQGAADWILGIGHIFEQGFEQIRFMHLSKNKLPGDKHTDGRERHGRWQTFIKPDIARYADI